MTQPGTKERKKSLCLPESLELQLILFIVMFLDRSYYVVLSQAIMTITKSIQFGWYITWRFQHLLQVCELVAYVPKQVFKIHNSSSRLKMHNLANNTRAENYGLHSFHTDQMVSHVNWLNSFAAN